MKSEWTKMITGGVESLPARGAWIEISVTWFVRRAVEVAPREGSVD